MNEIVNELTVQLSALDSKIWAAIIASFASFGIATYNAMLNWGVSKRSKKTHVEIENLKAQLQKKNKVHEIYREEYARLCFQRIDNLHLALIEFNAFLRDQLGTDYNLLMEEKEILYGYKLYRKTATAIDKARVYLSQDLIDACNKFIDKGDQIILQTVVKGRSSVTDENYSDIHVKWGSLFDDLKPTLKQVEKLIKESFDPDYEKP